MSHLPRSLRLFVFSWLALVASNCANAVEPPVRIMPLGDSITFGELLDSNELAGGYRRPLFSTLSTSGFNVDFIGTRTDGSFITFPDMNHEGWPGYRVDEINAEVGNWLNQLESPDVILLLIGTNDFLQTSRNETPAGVLAELDVLIKNLTTKKPYAKIIVSTLIPCTYFPNGVDVEAKQRIFNSGIPGLVSQHASLGHQVSMVDMHSALDTDDLSDGVHPSATGYDKMANAWRTAIMNVISPKGTANPPLIAKTETTSDLTKLVVTFSKPVADDSTALSNFNISGGVTVSAASLDPATKRTVTLTTSAQVPGEVYTLTVSGVRDRTTQQTLIAPQSKAMFYPNLVSNGSFEGSYSGWSTHTGHLEIKDKTTDFFPYTTVEGNKMVAFNTGDRNPNAVLAQSFPTTVGQTYRLTYNLGIASWVYSATQKLNVDVQGSNTRLNSTSIVEGFGSPPAVFWYPWSHEFTANTTTTTVTFTDTSETNQSFSKDMLLDNVKIVRANTGPYLAVTSTPDTGASITVSPTDLGGSGGGTTGLIRSYAAGTSVTLTAPSTSGGRSFQKWQLNGADVSGTHSITLTLNSNTTLNAYYDPNSSTTPVATADSYTINEDTQLSVSAPGLLVNDSNANATVLVTSPTKGSLSLNPDGSFTYTPNANANGADSFTYRASNGVVESATATVSLSVTPVNDTPVALPRSISVDEDESAATTLTGNDVEGTTLTFAVSAQPTYGSVSMNGAVATYTPFPDFHGTDSFSFTASDGVATSAPATVSLVVNPLDEFTQWLDGKSLIGGPTDDCDGDSISNALEFVLGGDPGQATMGNLLPTTDLIAADLDAIPGEEEYLRFSYRRSGRSKIDSTTFVEAEWATSLAGPWNSANGTHGERIVTEPGDPVDQVKVYIPRSLAANGLLFTRLKVVIDLPASSAPPAGE